MDTKNIYKFKLLLLQQQKELLEENENYLELHSEKVPDSLDAAAININQSIKTKLLKRKTLYLRKIDHALKRIKNGIYGECDWCGEDISENRLNVRPTAILCISCKEDQEKEEKEKNQIGGTISKWLPDPEY